VFEGDRFEWVSSPPTTLYSGLGQRQFEDGPQSGRQVRVGSLKPNLAPTNGSLGERLNVAEAVGGSLIRKAALDERQRSGPCSRGCLWVTSSPGRVPTASNYRRDITLGPANYSVT